MSGVEFITLIGILASIEQLVEASGRLVKTAVGFYRNSKELPKTLEELQTFLPGLALAVRRRSDPTMLERLNEADRHILVLIFKNLKDKVQELDVLLRDYLPAEDDSSGRKLMKAMGSLGVEKKIDKILKTIFERYMPLLTFATIENPTLPIELVSAAMGGTTLEGNVRPEPHYLVKIQRDDDFVGRKDVMSCLDVLLSPKDKHNRVALVALGGMGKTRIALEYALKYKRSTDTSVFWVHASSAGRISEAYDEIARNVRLLGTADSSSGGPQPVEKDKMRAVQNWLESDASGRWLLIIDNADDQDLFYGKSHMADYIPRSDLGAIIMTTRDKAVGLKFTGAASRVVAVQAMDAPSSRTLLEGKLEHDAVDEDSCQALAEELQGVPLALVQAAAYINEQSITIEEYLRLYRSSESSKILLLSEDFEDVVRKAHDTKSPIAATWIISFEIIQTRNPLAATILSRMCIMDSQALPISLLESGERSEDLTKALGTLQAFSMITLRKAESDQNSMMEKSFDLHRLVRLSMRNWLKLHAQLDLWTAITLKTLAQKYPDLAATGWEHQPKWTAYLPHALALLNSDQLRISPEDEGVASIFHAQGGIGQHADDGIICGLCAAKLMSLVSRAFEFLESPSGECLKWAQRAMVLREHILGCEHSETIESMYQYAKVLFYEDKLGESKEVGLRAVQLIATTPQPLSLQARSLLIRALVMSDQELFKEAEPLYAQCIDMCEEYYGPEHNETLLSIELLANNYKDQGRYDDSEKLLLQVLETRKKLFGPENAETLRVTQSLCTLYFETNRWEEAERMGSMISDMRIRTLGPKHPQTLLTMSNLAAAYEGAGRHEESIALGLQAVDLRKEVLGSEHPATLLTLSNLAYAYEGSGRLDEAEKLRSEVLESEIRVLGLTNRRTFVTMNDLAALYERRKKYVAAEHLRLQLVQLLIKILGVQNKRTIKGIQNLVNNYENQRRYLDVAAIGLDLVNILTAAYGPKHAETIQNMVGVAGAWMKLGRLFEAEKMVRSALELATGFLEPYNPTMIYCQRVLAIIAYQLAYYEEAENIFRQVLSTPWKEQEPHVEVILYTKLDLASLLMRESRFQEAETFLNSAGQLCSAVADPDASETMRVMQVSLLLDYYQGHFSKAEMGTLNTLKEECSLWTSQDKLGVQHLPLLMAMSWLGLLHGSVESYARADQISVLVCKAHSKLLGPANYKTLNSKLWACWNKSHMGQYESALALCLRTKESLEAMFAPTQEDVIFARFTLSRLYRLNGKYGEAEESALQALSSGTEAFGPRHMSVVRAKKELGAVLSAQGKLAQCEEVLLEALNTSVDLIGYEHPLTVSIRAELADTYEKLGKGIEAVAMKELAGKGREGLDFGLSEEDRKDTNELAQDVTKWLEREVSGVA